VRDHFVLELPDDQLQRRSIFKTVSPWLRASGYDLADDLGERLVFLKIK
jgi:hypothetical protein